MMTPKQRQFADARMRGLNQREAAEAAGCPAKTAEAAGCRYDKHPKIREYWRQHGFTPTVGPGAGQTRATVRIGGGDEIPLAEFEAALRSVAAPPDCDDGDDAPALLPATTNGDPLEFLRLAMDHELLDPKLRIEAAKSLAAYTVAKPAPAGKKQQAADKAKSGANRFAGAGKPPLRAV